MNNNKKKKIDKSKLKVFSEYTPDLVNFLKDRKIIYEIWYFKY